MISPAAMLDAPADQASSTPHQGLLAHPVTTSPMPRSHAACVDERLRSAITSLSGVGFDLVAAATMIEGDARDRVERAVAQLDHIMAALRYRFYEDIECGGTAGHTAGIDSSP